MFSEVQWAFIWVNNQTLKLFYTSYSTYNQPDGFMQVNEPYLHSLLG